LKKCYFTHIIHFQSKHWNNKWHYRGRNRVKRVFTFLIVTRMGTPTEKIELTLYDHNEIKSTPPSLIGLRPMS
jgi:hypothetical protein